VPIYLLWRYFACKQNTSAGPTDYQFSSIEARFINECMWFSENFACVRQQSKLSGVFTAKIIQYLQIKLYTATVV
jgi:hypothetical protein